MERLYTVEEARAALDMLAPTIEDMLTVRADVAELNVATAGGTPTRLGGLPELKAGRARLDELLSSIAETGVQVKGAAPLLLDFPAELNGESVLLCWLEGEPELTWYHRVDLGFPGRRRLSEID